jgi:uncharacterized protein YyaL (SSP411 family)
MMASAMLRAAVVLDDAPAGIHALATLDLLRREGPEPDALAHTPGGVTGLLDDQVQAAAAALDAYETTGNGEWLAWAEGLMERVWKDYWDDAAGGLFDTARAEVVDHAALEKAVRERGIRVGLDVFAAEPPGATGAFADPIVSLPNVYGTHHIGASTDQAQEAIAAETVRIITTYKDTGKVPNVVNLAKKTPATHLLVVRHRDRPGVLAHVFEHLRNGTINVQETENVIFEGAQAAVARINLDGAPSDALLKAVQDGNSDILDLHLVTI